MNLKKSALALALLGATIAGSAHAYVTPTITNTEGTLMPFGGLDWTQGSAAWTQGFAPVIGQTFTLYYAANAVAITDTSGSSMDTSDLDTSANGIKKAGNSYEYTIFATLTEKVIGLDFSTGSAIFQVTGGLFDIFYDTAANAKQSTGTGYLDGVKILSGSVSGSSGTQSFNNLTGGQATLQGKVSYTNSAYISPDMYGTTLTSTLQLGSAQTSFNAPTGFDYDNNGIPTLFTGANRPEVMFQADANQSFSQIPEPATLALVGISLLGLGASARRNRA